MKEEICTKNKEGEIDIEKLTDKLLITNLEELTNFCHVTLIVKEGRLGIRKNNQPQRAK